MEGNELTYFARSLTDGYVGLTSSDRRYHQYIIGRTGAGKTTMLENMIVADVVAGRGVGVIDPHGDLIERVLCHVPAARIADVVYVNPADTTHAIGFNVLRNAQRGNHDRVVSQIISTFKKHWAESWGPRLEHVLRNCLLTLIEHPNSTLLWMMKLLTHDRFRKRLVDRLDDPIVRAFWCEEFARYSERFRAEVIAPLQNKLGAFVTNAYVRHMLGQHRLSISIRRVMDEGKILLVRLPKGQIGEDVADILGTLFLSSIELAALERADMREEGRRDFYLYVDEFQNLATDSFATILSEARKYRLNLILAHQYLSQLPDATRNAIFGNVGTMIIFKVGVEDAQLLEREVQPEYGWLDLVNQSPYEIYYKLMSHGDTGRPRRAVSLSPRSLPAYHAIAQIEEFTRTHYARPTAEVEQEVRRFFGT